MINQENQFVLTQLRLTAYLYQRFFGEPSKPGTIFFYSWTLEPYILKHHYHSSRPNYQSSRILAKLWTNF